MTTARWDLPCDVTSPALARRLVRGVVAEHPAVDALADDAALLVSEVVANVVRHAQTSAHLRTTVGSHSVRVEVEDRSPKLPVISPHDGDEMRETGRGLTLVERIARAWGIERRRDGKVVWFELATTDDGRSGRRPAYLAG